MGTDDRLRQLTGSRPAAPHALVTLDAATLDLLAGALDVDRVELAATVRVLLRAHALAGAADEIDTDTWRADLPAAVATPLLAGAVGVAILQAFGIDSLPLTGLAALARSLFEVQGVEVLPSGALVRAHLRTAVGTDAGLRERLPEPVRSALPAAEFDDLVGRLVRDGQAAVGGEGLLLQPPGARHGFRLLLTESPVAPGGPRRTTTDSHVRRDLGALPGGPAPRVFVSYAHDSAAHKEQVRRLCYLLREHGIDVHMDQWDVGSRRDWQLWATDQIRCADYVLVVASPMCRRVGDGDVDPYAHRGLQSELRTLRELYHSEPAIWQRRCLPVVLPGGTISDIPLFLQPRTADHFRVTSLDLPGVEELLRLLTGQPAERRPELGPVPVLLPRPAPRQRHTGSG